jgi:hypothetical protein
MTALACAAFLPFLTAAPAQAQAFEGAITFRFTSDNGRTTETLQTTKGRKVRIEAIGPAAAGGSAWIMDPDHDRVLVVSPARKPVMTMTRAEIQQMDAMAKGS